jgi:hypothetical protein
LAPGNHWIATPPKLRPDDLEVAALKITVTKSTMMLPRIAQKPLELEHISTVLTTPLAGVLDRWLAAGAGKESIWSSEDRNADWDGGEKIGQQNYELWHLARASSVRVLVYRAL